MWTATFHNVGPDYDRSAQVEDFIKLSQEGPWRGSNTVSYGIAYDGWTVDDAASVEQIINLAK